MKESISRKNGCLLISGLYHLFCMHMYAYFKVAEVGLVGKNFSLYNC